MQGHLLINRVKGSVALKHMSLFEPSLCLSRACLGKMTVFVFQMAQKDAFSYLRHVALVRREVGAHEQQ
jgi:hypothetical protein